MKFSFYFEANFTLKQNGLTLPFLIVYRETVHGGYEIQIINESSRPDGNLDYYYLQNSSVVVTYETFFKS